MVFSRVLSLLMSASRYDPVEQLSRVAGGVPLPVNLANFVQPGESLSDLLVRMLLALITRPSSELGRHVAQYFHLFYTYATQPGPDDVRKFDQQRCSLSCG